MRPPRLSVPAAFALTIAALVLFLFQVHDPDFYWHVRAGELFLASPRLPDVDVFSSTAAGQPWFVQGWLADIVLWLTWHEGGLVGMRVLVAGFTVATWLLVYRSVRIYRERPETAVLLAGAALALIGPTIAPRPTLFTDFFFALVLHALLRYRHSGRIGWLLILPPVFAIWPNLHFGYVTGLGLIALFVVADALSRRYPFREQFDEPGSMASRGALVLVAISLAAVGLNPHGYAVYAETVRMAIVNSGTRISEWQSPSFGTLFGKAFVLVVCGFLAARAVGRRPLHWLDLVVPVVMISVGFSALRHIPLMAMTLAPFAARALPPNASSVWNLRKRSRAQVPAGKAGTFAKLNREIPPSAASLVNLALVVLVGLGAMLGSPRYARYAAERAAPYEPSGAADFILRNHLQGRLFNTYNSGGYLIYRLFPFQRVFIDGRYNPYPTKVVEDNFAISDGVPDWFERLERYSVDIVVCESESGLRQLMRLRPEFRMVYADEYYSVFVRDLPRFAALKTVPPAPPRKSEEGR